MIGKILRVIVIVLLVIMPYSTILSNFSPYWTDSSFNDFVIASIVFAAAALLLGYLVAGVSLSRKPGFLLFISGIIVAPPLMLGPPELSAALLQRTAEEHFRYGLLLVATVVFAAGFVLVLKSIWTGLSAVNKLIVVPLTASVILMAWDCISAYNLSAELKDWVDAGNSAEKFFNQYDFNELLRTAGRTLVYILVPWLAVLLLKRAMVKKWVVVVLSVFSIIGVVFFFLTKFIGMQFYFPFMVPAIALAPAYWLGLALVTIKHYKV